MNEYKARKIAKNIINELHSHQLPTKFVEIGNFKRKKQARELIKYCHSLNRLSLIGHRYRETSRWQVVWGEWCPIMSNNNGLKSFVKSDINDYDRLGFDLVTDLPGVQHDKHIFIVLSKHALERLVLRSPTEIVNSNDARNFMNILAKTLTLSCLAMLDENQDRDTSEGFLIENNLFIPIAMNTGVNRRLMTARHFVIKTVMPIDYNSSQKSIKTKPAISYKNNVFEYFNLLVPEKKLSDKISPYIKHKI